MTFLLILSAINALTPFWLGIFGGAFAVLETVALLFERGRGGKSGSTLSALVWRFIDWKKGPGHRVARGAFLVFWILLSSHFFFQTPLFIFAG